MLTIHHLGVSQSERIVWLCEELGAPYNLHRYERDSITRMAPPNYKALHTTGTAPVIADGDLLLAESGAIVEYIVAKYGDFRLTVGRESASFANYLFWFHYANATLMPSIMGGLARKMAEDDPYAPIMRERRDRPWNYVESRLSQAPFFAGDDFTAADIMMVFPLTTMRVFAPRDLGPFPAIRSYLMRVGARPAYQRAMQKADPQLLPLLS